MQEELVTFETAKLAKEKCFDVPVDTYLTKKNKDVNRKLKMRAPLYNFNQLNNIFSRPTQSLLQRWLREVHNIIVEPRVFDVGWLEENKFTYQYRIYNKSDKDKDVYNSVNEYRTLEEALEACLQEALKLIK